MSIKLDDLLPELWKEIADTPSWVTLSVALLPLGIMGIIIYQDASTWYTNKVSLTFIVLLFCFAVALIFKSYPWRHFGAKNAPAREQRHALIRIALPLSEGPKDNALMQVAGFLAAKRSYANEVTLEFLDHENNPQKTKQLIEEGLNESNSDPVRIIATMSNALDGLEAILSNELRKQDKDRLTLLTTVASASSITPNGKWLFRHFIDARAEADKLIERMECQRDQMKLTSPRLTVLYQNSAYPKWMQHYISKETDIKRGYTVRTKQLSSAGCPPNGFNLDSPEGLPNFVLLAMYGKEISVTLKWLVEQGFQGVVFAGTPLSVWYWRPDLEPNKQDFGELGFDLLFIDMLDLSNALAHGAFEEYQTNLEKVSIEDITAVSKTLGESIKEGMFQDILPIQSNYISAYCYDSVRLMLSGSKRNSLTDIFYEASQDGQEKIGQSDRCIFDHLLFDRGGSTHVSLQLQRISTPSEE